ncbi:head-tail connector protein [Enterococcus sp. ALS3]|uniref:Head-tail connector protein n=1 Tax=Enterococcus alishanensis TaxID=1303817 RepID=A0ABS6TDS5_9ENTE|nr:head-tail connector protein [Enterococcus alishanensis]MBV7391056.1 head-tail connector protein [Enterococcus alishanensis]
MLDPSKDLEELKSALKIEYEDDDIEIKRACTAAIAYIKGAIGRDKPSFYTQNNEISEMLNLAVIMLADHYYKARSATIESTTANGTLREYDLGFTSILLQLKAEYLVYKEVDQDGS